MRFIVAITCVLLLASTAAARVLTGSKPVEAAKPAGAAVASAKPAGAAVPSAKPAGAAVASAAPAAAPSVAAALQSTPDLSTLLAAVKAAGITIAADKAWTILAPTNEAFVTGLKVLNTTADKLLLPKNKDLLTRVLQYHVIPSGAILSSQLKDNQTVATALPGVAPLTVRVETKDGKANIKFVGATNSAMVITPDIKAGNSVVHIVKDVLLPAGIGSAGDADEDEGKQAEKGEKAETAQKMSNTVATAAQASAKSVKKP